MVWRNTQRGYGLVAIMLHWLVALAVAGLFALGLWMVGLNYYHPWYQRAPDIHRSVGVLLLGVVLARLAWRLVSPPPRPEPGTSARQVRVAVLVHGVLDLLILAVILSGYLITTAEGHPVDVFGLFPLPATLSGLAEQATRAGQVHLVLAIVLVMLAGGHALAAFKHHCIDRDRTLVRMFRPGG